MVMNDATIGGFFGLEACPGISPSWMERARGFVSGRAAIAAMLTARGQGAVWVPHYVCGAVREGVIASGLVVYEYMLAEDFGPPDNLPLNSTDTLLIVDYFGVTGKTVERTLKQYGSDRVLVDASQSLFFPAETATHVVYSPRKFVGLPDGGLLVSTEAAESRGEADERGSMRRMEHLLLRTAGRREEGRERFQTAEESLTFSRAEPMSSLTRFLLAHVDLLSVARIRQRNAQALFASRPDRHPILFSAPSDAVPMCAPVVVRRAPRVRAALADRGMFLAHYWPDAIVPAGDRNARLLLEETLFLPCDQRYTLDDMERLSSQFLQASISP
jgi:hypothetical protein